MHYFQKFIFFFVTIIFCQMGKLSAQSWNYIKEKNGIKVYTRAVLASSLKTTKGEVIIHAPIENIFSLLANPDNTDWWDKDIREKKMLIYKKNTFIQYYLIYKMPWPFTDRDMVIESRISIDPVTNIRTVVTKPLPNVIPENADLVRIDNYWQRWTLSPLDHGNVLVSLEGFVDPGGNIPTWLYNMVITETPLKAINLLRNRVLSSKSIRD